MRTALNASPARARRPFWRSPLLHPLNSPQAWDRLLQLAQPRWSVSEGRATVVDVVDETATARSLWLRPNARFRGFRPGQHALVSVVVDGVRHARCYSFSQAPRADRLLRITVQKQAGGTVSHALHALRRGDVVRLDAAQGDFTAPAGDGPLLLLSAGSGITPMLALLHDWADRQAARDVVLLHTARDAASVIAADELQALAARWPRLAVQLHYSGAGGRLDAATLQRQVPDWTQRTVLACGPDGLLEWLQPLCNASDVPLRHERFGARRLPPTAIAGDARAVHCSKSERSFTVAPGTTLLDGAEAAGLRPAYGCRRGICRTCQCRKLGGRVTNLLTGQTSGPGDELIQLCISTPLDAVEIVL